MLFSLVFEIGALILGLFYIGHLYFTDIIDIIELTRDIDKEEKETKQISEVTKRLYS